MGPEDQKPDDLQHLVAEEYRGKVAVLPKKSFQLAFTAWGLIACGFGFWIGAAFSGKIASIIGPILIIAGFIVGKFNNRQEGKLLEKINSDEA